MHMADALLSPAVGTTLWTGSAAVAAWASRKLKRQIDEGLIPLMGVLGAFIFAAQMINFTIPGTGSSGHLGGGMILAILLGPPAAFLVMASVLTVQALFFADGGLLALGCNLWNLGFYPCCLVYPLLYKPIVGRSRSPVRIFSASVLGSLVALQLGAFSVVLETLASGISELPFTAFLWLMQPIHLAIGVVEGVVTGGIVLYILGTRPEIVEGVTASRPVVPGRPLRKALIALGVMTLVTGGVLSWFASTLPDGLEWSIERITGSAELVQAGDGITRTLKEFQEKTAFLPDYSFKAGGDGKEEAAPAWPTIETGTSAAGLIGSGIVLGIVGLIGLGIRTLRRRSQAQ